ncbi:MAG: hypothetical protein ACLTEM_01175 [Segatella copri]
MVQLLHTIKQTLFLTLILIILLGIKIQKKLVITYTNGNIDLLDANGNIINIPDLYLKSMTDNKQINHIYISGTNAYLSLSFWNY